MKHLLQEHKILKVFNVRKFINIKDLYKDDEILDKNNEEKIKELAINEMAKQSIENVPGVIEETKEEKRLNFISLNIESLIKHFKSNKFNDTEICAILVHIMKEFDINTSQLREFLNKI